MGILVVTLATAEFTRFLSEGVSFLEADIDLVNE